LFEIYFSRHPTPRARSDSSTFDLVPQVRRLAQASSPFRAGAATSSSLLLSEPVGHPAIALAGPARAAEGPFFVTYTHQMEEPGNLEIATRNVMVKPADGNRFFGATTELEYGIKAWWTTELYLDGQATRHDGALFTGYRWENRVRPLLREHWINPVLYVEFENINGADRSLLEVVNHDGQDDLAGLNGEARQEKKREAALAAP
jgi:hypothetical protein